MNILTESGMRVISHRPLETGHAAIVQSDSERTQDEVIHFLERTLEKSGWFIQQEISDEIKGTPRFFWLAFI